MALTINEIRQARERISPHVIRTPLLRMQNLDQYLGCEVYVKAECMQKAGSFKYRGAMNRMPGILNHLRPQCIQALHSMTGRRSNLLLPKLSYLII